MICQRRNIRGCVTAALMFSLACSRPASHYLDKGKQLAAQGKLGEAALNFSKALQKDPKLAAAYLELGDLYARQNKKREAYVALSLAVQLLPDQAQAKVKLANFCLADFLADPGRPKLLYNQIVELSRQLLARDPSSFDGHRLQGYVSIFDGRPEQALEHFTRANEIRPNEPTVIHALTQVLFQTKQPGEAETMALELVEKRKDFGPIYDVLYRYYESGQRANEAEQLMKSKVANNPQNALFALQLAAHYARTKSHEAMAATLQRLLDNPHDFPNARLSVGDFYVALGEPEQARRYYEDGIRNAPLHKVDYQKRLAQLLAAQGKREEALKLLDSIVKATPDDVPSRAGRASLLLGSASMADREAAVTELQNLAGKNPNDAALRQVLGQALAGIGQADQARRQFVEVIKLRRNALPPRFALAELALRRRDYQEAGAYAAELLELSPDEPRARLILATTLVGTGKFTEADQALKRLVKDVPDFIDAELQLGNVHIARKKYSEAEAAFRKYYRPGASDTRPAEGLARLYLAWNQPQKAIDAWKQEVDKAPEATSARLALASTALAVGQKQMAIEQYQALLDRDPKSANLQYLLAQAYRSKGDNESAIAAARKATELDPGAPGVSRFLGVLLDTGGLTQEAIPVYRRALQLEPSDAVVLNNLAFALAETGGNLDEATELAVRAQKLMADQPTIADTLGWIYAKKNMPDSAIQIFRNLAARYPSKSTYRYHLGVALLLNGEKAGARAELQAALQRAPSRVEEQKIRELLGKIG